jgi:hypothetical protein
MIGSAERLGQLLALDGDDLACLARLERKLPGLLGEGDWAGLLAQLQKGKPTTPTNPLNDLDTVRKQRDDARNDARDLTTRLKDLHEVLGKHLGVTLPGEVDAKIAVLRRRADAPSPPPPPPPPPPARSPVINTAVSRPPSSAQATPSPTRQDDLGAFEKQAEAIAKLDPQRHPTPPGAEVMPCNGCSQTFFTPSGRSGRNPTKCWSCLGSAGRGNRIHSLTLMLKEAATRATSKSGG